MPTTLIGLIRSDIRRIVDKKQKTPRRLERRLSALESKLRALAASVRKLSRGSVRPAGSASPAGGEPSGAQIRAARERMGLTREVFAKRLKVSPSIIFLWESGRSRPRRSANVEALQKLLRSGTPNKAAAKSSQSAGMDGSAIRALRARLRLSREKFAKRVGVSSSMIFLWESGRSTPRRRSSLEKLRNLTAQVASAKSSAKPAKGRRAKGRGKRG